MPAPVTTTLLALAFLLQAAGEDSIAVAVGVVGLIFQLAVFLTAAVVEADEPESV